MSERQPGVVDYLRLLSLVYGIDLTVPQPTATTSTNLHQLVSLNQGRKDV